VSDPALSASPNPVLVEVTRGAMVESRHRGAVAIVDAHGHVELAVGDTASPVYARSGLKPIQALPLIETGAADAFALTEAEIALACASHNGEPHHVEIVTAWLARIGLDVDALGCGVSLPATEAAQRALFESGGTATAAHDNCSGKHTGFLTVARHLSYPAEGYTRLDHPVQQRVLGVLEQMTGLDLSAAPLGLDGCGIPVIGIPLGNLALAMARLGDPHDQPELRQTACARIRAAMTAEPFLIAGTGRFCTRAIQALGGRVLVKTGAEGVYCATVPEAGLGIAIKIDDGARRAAETVMIRVLDKLDVIDVRARGLLLNLLEPAVHTRAGQVAGYIRIADDAPI